MRLLIALLKKILKKRIEDVIKMGDSQFIANKLMAINTSQDTSYISHKICYPKKCG